MESSKIIEEIKIQLARTLEIGDADEFNSDIFDSGSGAGRGSYNTRNSSPSGDLLKSKAQVQFEVEANG